jgi:hypothetical protein
MREQAADIVKLVGIGRNEYIDIMNKCKAKKLLWRVNKAIVKEHLPTDPLDFDLQPWWIVHVVNLGKAKIPHPGEGRATWLNALIHHPRQGSPERPLVPNDGACRTTFFRFLGFHAGGGG